MTEIASDRKFVDGRRVKCCDGKIKSGEDRYPMIPSSWKRIGSLDRPNWQVSFVRYETSLLASRQKKGEWLLVQH